MPFKKAFDSVWRSTLFIKLQPVKFTNKKNSIRGKLYNIIHDLYSANADNTGDQLEIQILTINRQHRINGL
jgi:hypothetical protein